MNYGYRVRMALCAAQGREHLQFLLRLKDIMPLRTAFLEQLETAVAKQGFELQVRLSLCCSTTHAAVPDTGMVHACCCFAVADVAKRLKVCQRNKGMLHCPMQEDVVGV